MHLVESRILSLGAHFFHLPDQRLNSGFEIRVEFEPLIHFLARMHDSRVISSTELEAQLRGGIFGNFSRNVHGDLARKGDVACPFFSFKIHI